MTRMEGFLFAALKGRSFTKNSRHARLRAKAKAPFDTRAFRPGVSCFFRAEATRSGGPPGRPRRDCTEKTLPLIPLMTLIFTDLNWAGRKLLFGNDTEGRDGFVKMAGFQFPHRTTSQLIRLAKVRYSGSFLSLFTKFERLRRHNFAHFTSSPLEKRVIRHELLDCRWTEADQRAV